MRRKKNSNRPSHRKNHVDTLLRKLQKKVRTTNMDTFDCQQGDSFLIAVPCVWVITKSVIPWSGLRIILAIMPFIKNALSNGYSSKTTVKRRVLFAEMNLLTSKNSDKKIKSSGRLARPLISTPWVCNYLQNLICRCWSRIKTDDKSV